eukprot:1856707-Rhodomonas_salina.1
MLTGVGDDGLQPVLRRRSKQRQNRECRRRTRLLNAHWCLTPVLRSCRSNQRQNPRKSPSRTVPEYSLVDQASAAYCRSKQGGIHEKLPSRAVLNAHWSYTPVLLIADRNRNEIH